MPEISDLTWRQQAEAAYRSALDAARRITGSKEASRGIALRAALDVAEGCLLDRKLSDLAADCLDNPTARALKVIARAEELGWTVGVVSLCVRVSKPDDKPDRGSAVALPFYATWTCTGRTKTGKPSWSFMGAGASNMQALSESDILTYLESPEVIHPNPPKEGTE